MPPLFPVKARPALPARKPSSLYLSSREHNTVNPRGCCPLSKMRILRCSAADLEERKSGRALSRDILRDFWDRVYIYYKRAAEEAGIVCVVAENEG